MKAHEYIELFERKSYTPWSQNPGEVIVFHPGHGFLGYRIDVFYDELHIIKMVGDGKYWRRKVAELYKALKECGVRKVRLWTHRNPRAYTRWIGGNVVDRYPEKNGKTLYEIEVTEATAKEGWDTL